MMGTKLRVLLFLLMPRLQAQKQARQRQNKMQISRRNARLTSQQTASDVADAERLNRLRIGANIALWVQAVYPAVVVLISHLIMQHVKNGYNEYTARRLIKAAKLFNSRWNV